MTRRRPTRRGYFLALPGAEGARRRRCPRGRFGATRLRYYDVATAVSGQFAYKARGLCLVPHARATHTAEDWCSFSQATNPGRESRGLFSNWVLRIADEDQI